MAEEDCPRAINKLVEPASALHPEPSCITVRTGTVLHQRSNPDSVECLFREMAAVDDRTNRGSRT